MASPVAAANAYAALAKLTSPAAAAKPPGAATGGPDFSTLLRNVVGGIVETGQAADVQTKAVAAGKGSIVDVVTAVSETEVAIQTLVSVRDRVIQSYEEIMRMPI